MSNVNDWQPGPKSQEMFGRAKELMPGGVNSPRSSLP
jgi:glutamate-1-semialdehyde aminotransferase